jgi:hypothetical protein
MLSATGTAYPLLKPNPSERELNDIFNDHLIAVAQSEGWVRQKQQSA